MCIHTRRGFRIVGIMSVGYTFVIFLSSITTMGEAIASTRPPLALEGPLIFQGGCSTDKFQVFIGRLSGEWTGL